MAGTSPAMMPRVGHLIDQNSLLGERADVKFRIAAASVLLAASFVGSAWGQQAEDVKEGRRLADLICANCHVVANDQIVSPILQPPAPSFESIAQRSSFNADSVTTFLRTMHRDARQASGMPNLHLLEYEIKALVVYLASLQKQG